MVYKYLFHTNCIDKIFFLENNAYYCFYENSVTSNKFSKTYWTEDLELVEEYLRSNLVRPFQFSDIFKMDLECKKQLPIIKEFLIDLVNNYD